MAYVVVTGLNRKEFDKLRDALEYRTQESVIYEMDAFGNMRPLSNDMINELLKTEPISNPPQQQAPPEQKPVNVTVNLKQEPQEKLMVDYKAIEQKELGHEVKQKSEESGLVKIIKYFLIFLMLLALIGFAVWVLMPFMKDLNSIMSMDFI